MVEGVIRRLSKEGRIIEQKWGRAGAKCLSLNFYFLKGHNQNLITNIGSGRQCWRNFVGKVNAEKIGLNPIIRGGLHWS